MKKLARSKYTLFLLLTFLTSAAALIPLKKELDRRLRKQQEKFRALLEESGHYRIRYRSLAPRLLFYMKFKDFEISRRSSGGSPPRKIFSAGELLLSYNLWNLLSRKGKSSIREIKIKNAVFDLQKKSFGELRLTSFSASEKTSPPSSFSVSKLESYLSPRFRLKGYDIRGTFKGERSSFRFSRINFQLHPGANRKNYFFSLRTRLRSRAPYAFRSEVSAQGSLRRDLRDLTAKLWINSFRSDYFSLKEPESLTVRIPDTDKIIFENENTSYALNGFFVPSDSSFQLSFGLHDFTPEKIFDIRYPLPPPYAPFRPKISGRGLLRFNEGAWNYDSDLRASLASSFSLFPRNVKVQFSGDQKKLNIRNLRLYFPRGRLFYRGSWDFRQKNLRGAGQIKNFSPFPGYRINTDFRLRPSGRGLLLQADHFKINNLLFPVFRNLLTRSDGKIQNDFLMSKDDRGFNEDIRLRWIQKPSYRIAKLSLSSLSGQTLAALLPPPFSSAMFRDEFENWKLETRFWFYQKKGESPQGVFPQIRFRNALRPKEELSLRADFSEETLRISRFYAFRNGYKLSGYGSGNFRKNNPDFRAVFRLNQFTYSLRALYERQKALLTLRGNYGLEASIRKILLNPKNPQNSKNRKEEIRMELKTDSLPIPLRNSPASLFLRLNSTGLWDSDSASPVFNFETAELKTEKLPFLNNPTLELRGQFKDSVFRFPSVIYRDPAGTLRGRAEIKLPRTGGPREFLLNFRGDGAKALEYHSLRAVLGPEKKTIRVRLRNFSLNHLKDNLEGNLTGSLDFSGNGDSLNLTGDLDIRNAYRGYRPFDFKGKIRLKNNTVLQADRFSATYGDNRIRDAYFSLNLKKKYAALTGRILSRLSTYETSTRMSLSFQGSGRDPYHWKTLPRQIKTNPFELYLKTDDLFWNGRKTFPSLTFLLKKDSKQILFRELRFQGLGGRYTRKNRQLEMNIKAPFPVHFTAEGSVQKEKLRLTVRNFFTSLTFANYFIPPDAGSRTPYVLFRSGEVRADSFTVEGTPASPLFSGRLNLSNLSPSTAYNRLPFKTVDHYILLKGDKLTMPALVIPLQKSPKDYLVLKADLELLGWNIKKYLLDMNLRKIPLKYKAGSLGSEGFGNGHMLLEGNLQRMDLSGDLGLDNLSLYLDPADPDPPEKNYPALRKKKARLFNFFLNLKVTTGKNNRLYLPNREVRVLQTRFKPDQELRIYFNTLNKNLSVYGILAFLQGDIRYLNNAFFLQKGAIFFNENSNSLNPRLFFEARLETKDEGGEPLRILMSYNGRILDPITPRLDSLPPKDPETLKFLVSRFILPAGVSRSNGISRNTERQTTLSDTISFVGQQALLNPLLVYLSEELKDTLNIDDITINIHALSIFLNQLDRTKTVDNIRSLLDGSNITGKINLSDELKLNLGLSTAYQSRRGIKVLPSLGFSLRIPFSSPKEDSKPAGISDPFFQLDLNYISQGNIQKIAEDIRIGLYFNY